MKPLNFFLMALVTVNLQAQKTKHVATNKTLAGVWELVAVKSVAADSSVTYPYGQNPVGNMILGDEGYYSVQIYNNSRNKISSGNKNTATPEENIVLVKGSNAHYGFYSVKYKDALIIFKPEHAFFPNWEGQELKQHYVLEGKTLTYSSDVSTFGAARSIVVWKKK